MRAWSPYLFAPLILIVAALPGCSGCSSEQVNQSRPPSASESQPAADSVTATESSEPSKTELENRNQSPATPEPAESAKKSNPSETLPEGDGPSTSAGASGAGVAPESQIQQWLEAARREQQKGQNGQAYAYAADASGLLRKVKDPRQRQTLQTQVDAILAAVEPAIERKFNGTDTLTDSKPLIEK